MCTWSSPLFGDGLLSKCIRQGDDRCPRGDSALRNAYWPRSATFTKTMSFTAPSGPTNLIVNSARGIQSATLIDLGSTALMLSHSSEPERFLEQAKYYSPEQAGSIDHDITQSTDLYSAGVLLFECLAGYPPFSGTRSQFRVVQPHDNGRAGIEIARIPNSPGTG